MMGASYFAAAGSGRASADTPRVKSKEAARASISEHRSPAVAREFQREHPCPSFAPIDLIEHGGSNLFVFPKHPANGGIYLFIEAPDIGHARFKILFVYDDEIADRASCESSSLLDISLVYVPIRLEQVGLR